MKDMKLILDHLCFFILVEIYNAGRKNHATSTWTIANKYKWADYTERMTALQKQLFMHKKDALVRKRLSALGREGIVNISKNSWHNFYEVKSDRVEIRKMKFPDGKKKAIVIKDKWNKWCAFEL